MGPLNLPYGQLPSPQQRAALKQLDQRFAGDEDRLLWIDGISLVDRRYWLNARRLADEQIQIRSVPISEGVVRSGKNWHALKAFDATERSAQHWSRVQIANVQLALNAFQPAGDVDALAGTFGLAHIDPRNPLLRASVYGKQLLVSSVSLILAVLAPSEGVFANFMHPLDRLFYARSDPQASVIDIRSVLKVPTRVWTACDLCCLAYWLHVSSDAHPGASVYDSIIGGNSLQPPKSSDLFTFAIDGYESDDAILVQSLGQLQLKACWPSPWGSVRMLGSDGRPFVGVSAGTDGAISAAYRLYESPAAPAVENYFAR